MKYYPKILVYEVKVIRPLKVGLFQTSLLLIKQTCKVKNVSDSGSKWTQDN
jgi:hypothetical protein